MKKFRNIAIAMMVFILVMGCGATSAAPKETAEQVTQTTEEQAEQVTEEAVGQTTEEQAEQVTEEAVGQTTEEQAEQTTEEQAEQVLVVTYSDGGYVEVTRTEEGLLVKTSAGDEFPMTGNMPWDELPFGQTVKVDDLQEPFWTAFRDFPH